jgi:orotate phosphoribosyltransferase
MRRPAPSQRPRRRDKGRRRADRGAAVPAYTFGAMTTLKRDLDLAARAEIARRTEALFRSSGALRDGHFLLKSGRHSDAYLEKFAVLSDPAATSELCGFWAAQFRRGDAAGAAVDLVAGPTTGGVILAFETGRQLGTRAIFAEEVRAEGGASTRQFRRGFQIDPGERVLLVDDILTTGGSLLAMLPAVEASGGEIVECVVLVDRSGGMATLTSPATGRVYPLRALWSLDLPTYEPGAATCPRCAAGEPLHAPGSTGASA